MAGHIYPQEAPRPTTSAAELDLYGALRRQLPDGWTAWHSLRLRIGTKWEGEGDFVIAVPERGLLVLEVKGGRVTLEGGRWFQNGRAMPKAPRDQAQTFVRHLVGEVARPGAKVPAFGVACAFPDVDFSDGPTSGDVRGLVLGRRDLPWLGQVLPGLVERALPGRPPQADLRWIERLHELWGETWVPHVRLRDRVQDAQSRAVALNETQLGVLDIAGENRRASVEGGAGTGKTVLARELCLRRVRRGDSALYLCFTDALAKAVGASFPALPGRVDAVSLRRRALELTQEPAPSDPEGWRALLLRAAALVLPRHRADLVVVDEAQDLDVGDWALVEALSNGCDLWVFSDPVQRFWAERTMPAHLVRGGAQLKLFSQQRNPSDVAALAHAYVSSTPAPRPARPGPMSVEVAEQGEELAVVTRLLDRLMRDGAHPSEIAVVSLAGQTRSDFVRLDRLGAHLLARADAPDAASHAIADTFLRFKGLERPFVIVVELNRARDVRYDTRMHIALTRATAECVVVCDRAGLEADPRLAPYCWRTARRPRFPPP